MPTDERFFFTAVGSTTTFARTIRICRYSSHCEAAKDQGGEEFFMTFGYHVPTRLVVALLAHSSHYDGCISQNPIHYHSSYLIPVPIHFHIPKSPSLHQPASVDSLRNPNAYAIPTMHTYKTHINQPICPTPRTLLNTHYSLKPPVPPPPLNFTPSWPTLPYLTVHNLPFNIPLKNSTSTSVV